MDAFVSDTLEFVESCDQFNSVSPLLERFSEVVNRFGFNHFIMTGLPSRGEDVEDLIVADKWPDGWRDHYRDKAYFMQDPVTQWSFSCSAPFSWREARIETPTNRVITDIEQEANEYGLVDGLGFPMFDPTNWQAVVSLASDAPCDLDKRQIGLVYLASVYCQMRASELRKPNAAKVSELTPREREVLRWVAAGKSYWETSTILGISEATVQTHLIHVRRKLHAANTTEAVARAIMSRQILI